MRADVHSVLSMTSVKEKKDKPAGLLSFRTVSDILALTFLWVFAFLTHKYPFIRIESKSLFLYDTDFLLESFRIPGGFLGWAGEFLTQFLHHPWMGTLIWVLLIALTVRLVRKTYPALCRPIWAAAYIPASAMAVYAFGIGYGYFLMKSTGWFFVPVLGTLYALSIVYLFGKTRGPMARYAVIIAATVAGYALTGAWALAGTLLAVLSLTANEGFKKAVPYMIAAVIIVLCVPPAMKYLYTTFRADEIYTVGLPLLDYKSQMPVRLPCFTVLLFMAIAPFIRSGLPTELSDGLSTDGNSSASAGRPADRTPSAEKPSIELHSVRPTVAGVVTQTAIIAACLISILAFSYNDLNFRTECAMSAAVDRNDWQKVADILKKAESSSAKSDERAYSARSSRILRATGQAETDTIIKKFDSRFYKPTRLMVLYKDMALFLMGKEADEMFTYRDGDRKQKSRYHIPMAFQAGKQIYFYYGMINYSHRWCIEETVEYGWNYAALQYDAMSAMIMEEWDLAEKYISLLEKTLYYKKWAAEQRKMLGDREKMAAAESYSKVLPLLCYDSRLSNDEVMIEPFLMTHFISDRTLNATPEFDRATMMWALRTQDIGLFWASFLNYLETNKPTKIPRHYQEAAVMYSALAEDTALSSLPFDKQISIGYEQFMNYTKTNPVRNLEESAYQYSKRFGKTFWFYYFFIRGQKTF